MPVVESRTDPCGILFPGIGPALVFISCQPPCGSCLMAAAVCLFLSFSWNRMPVLFSFLYSFAIPGVNKRRRTLADKNLIPEKIKKKRNEILTGS